MGDTSRQQGHAREIFQEFIPICTLQVARLLLQGVKRIRSGGYLYPISTIQELDYKAGDSVLNFRLMFSEEWNIINTE